MVAAARESGVLRRGQGVERLQEMADRGSAPARAVYAEAATLLARAVAGLLTVLDPEVVIVLGEGTAAWAHWDEPFRGALRAAATPAARAIPVEVESWDDTSWAPGRGGAHAGDTLRPGRLCRTAGRPRARPLPRRPRQLATRAAALLPLPDAIPCSR